MKSLTSDLSTVVNIAAHVDTLRGKWDQNVGELNQFNMAMALSSSNRFGWNDFLMRKKKTWSEEIRGLLRNFK